MIDFSQPDAPLTPEQQRKKQKRQTWLALGFVWGIIAVLDGRKWVHSILYKAAILDISWPVLVLGWIIGLPILYWLVIVVHEGGHVVGALFARFQILSFVASWLHVKRKAKGWQIQLRKPAAKLSGMVQAFPTHDRNLRSRYALFIAGGPLANILTGALALYSHSKLSAAPDIIFSVSGYALYKTLLIFGWLSVATGGLNLLPLNLTSGHIIDGRKLWHLLKGGPVMRQHLGLLYFQNLTYAGVRPRDWEIEQVKAFLANQSNSVLDFYAHFYAYCYYHDCKDLESTQSHLNEAIALRKMSPIALQQQVLAEAAYIAALHTHDVEQARYWLDCAQEAKPFTCEEGLFSRAAVAFVERQFSEAEEWLQAARQQLQETIQTGSSVQAFECMNDLQAKIQHAQAQLQLV
ncbi:hypothetical protein [Hymenobacter profundi]|uniref:Peptidase M50 domain-containing protein n=1 Tax=Hymenobacter profundi TaxID=1982110 RepID=A0ABS6X3B6_9BACT|nr:hypothetical protein [Hymenobacter profundi]MBW3130329.1 hypothetical protein [Hymenobacter profundi]